MALCHKVKSGGNKGDQGDHRPSYTRAAFSFAWMWLIREKFRKFQKILKRGSNIP